MSDHRRAIIWGQNHVLRLRDNSAAENRRELWTACLLHRLNRYSLTPYTGVCLTVVKSVHNFFFFFNYRALCFLNIRLGKIFCRVNARKRALNRGLLFVGFPFEQRAPWCRCDLKIVKMIRVLYPPLLVFCNVSTLCHTLVDLKHFYILLLLLHSRKSICMLKHCTCNKHFVTLLETEGNYREHHARNYTPIVIYLPHIFHTVGRRLQCRGRQLPPPPAMYTKHLFYLAILM